jgi:glucans biosynthesis protein C
LSTSKRFHALDSLRGFLMILGVFYHTAQHYSGEINSSLNPDRSTAWLFFYLNIVIHLLRMPLFFAISGYLAGLLIHRKGSVWFLKNRFNRILLPFLLFLILLSPIVDYLRLWRLSILEENWTTFTPAELLFPDKLLHLWFLYYLAVYSSFLGAIAWVSEKLKNKTLMIIFSVLIFVISSSIFLTSSMSGKWIELKTYFILSAWNNSTHFCHETSMGCIFHASTFWSYFSLYVLGYVIYKSNISASLLIQWWPLSLILSILTFWLGYGLSITDHKLLINVAFCVFGSITLLGFFLDKVSNESGLLRFLSDSSYWLYLAHYPLVIFFCSVLIPVEGMALFKFLLICTIIIFLLLMSYNYLVRVSWLGKFLNGQRRPPWQILSKTY